jgi:hypothetical protein
VTCISHAFSSNINQLLIGNARHKNLVHQDAKITQRNKKIKTIHVAKGKAEIRLSQAQRHNHSASDAVVKATRAYDRARSAFQRAVTESLALMGTGSGKVPVSLPTNVYMQSRPQPSA